MKWVTLMSCVMILMKWDILMGPYGPQIFENHLILVPFPLKKQNWVAKTIHLFQLQANNDMKLTREL